MPDWEQLVGDRLGRLKLPREERREVVEELAAHLEDCYAELRHAGSPDPEGYTLAQVPDWEALSRKIRRSKEGPMNKTVRIVLCGMLAGAVASLLALAAFVLLGQEFLATIKGNRADPLTGPLQGLLHLAAGIWTMWLYSAIRSTYGPGTKTAVRAGLALVVIGVLSAANWTSMDLIPFNFFLAAVLIGLPAWMIGMTLGAWSWEASERKPSQALKAT
jgi:hypothetical protein